MWRGQNLSFPLLVGIGLFNLSNSDGMIASPAPGSYTLYSTEMSLGFEIQVGKQYFGEQFVVKSYDGACTVVNLGKVR